MTAKYLKLVLLPISLLLATNLAHTQEINKSTPNVTMTNNEKNDITENNKYMKSVFKLTPDMQQKGSDSKKTSINEGAALQLVTGSSNLYVTGLTNSSLAALMNIETKGVKKFFKEKNMKGYFFVEHTIIVTNGIPKLDKEQEEQFKDQSNCNNGYCTIVVVSNLKLLDENGKEQDFSKKELEKYIKAEDNNKENLQINPQLVKSPYETITVKIILGYGLGGLDALQFFKSNNQ